MTLGHKLIVVFCAFVAILVIVLYMSLRERRLGKTIAQGDRQAEQASDARVLAVIFSAILGGMFLTLIVAYLLFF